jgi:hypothetical protein
MGIGGLAWTIAERSSLDSAARLLPEWFPDMDRAAASGRLP